MSYPNSNTFTYIFKTSGTNSTLPSNAASFYAIIASN